MSKMWKRRFFFKFKSLFKPFFNKGLNHKNCSHCNLKHEIEPGFFYGAMYVSYALAIGLGCFLLILLISILGKDQLFTIIGIISLSILVFSPVNYYLSRLIWLNVFIDKTKL